MSQHTYSIGYIISQDDMSYMYHDYIMVSLACIVTLYNILMIELYTSFSRDLCGLSIVLYIRAELTTHVNECKTLYT